MAATTPEERHAIAGRVAEMTALVERLLRGEITRTDAEIWAVHTARAHGGAAFRGHFAAKDLLTSLYNLDRRHGDGPLIRDVDLRAHLDLLRHGEPSFCEPPVGAVAKDVPSLADQLGEVAARTWVEGIGCFDIVRFTSRATGRPWSAISQVGEGFRCTSIYTTPLPTDAAARSAVVIDLLDTLVLELSDLTHLPFEVDIPCWRLGRTDDNGQSATVATFRGYAKAAAALAAFEARAHKQTYWLERVDEP